MKDTIVMCPTLQRATMEWNHFCYVYRSMIQRAVRGFHADICLIDEFIGKVEKDEKSRRK